MTEGGMDLGIDAQQDADSRTKDKWDVLPMPRLDGDTSKSRAALNAGWGLCLSSQTGNEEMAWAFLKWASGVDMAETMIATNETGIDPCRRSAVNRDAYLSANARSQPIVSVALEHAMPGLLSGQGPIYCKWFWTPVRHTWMPSQLAKQVMPLVR